MNKEATINVTEGLEQWFDIRTIFFVVDLNMYIEDMISRMLDAEERNKSFKIC